MFPGTSEYNQIFKIVDMLGPPPRHMIEVGKNSFNFFKKSTPPPPPSTTTIIIIIIILQKQNQFMNLNHLMNIVNFRI